MIYKEVWREDISKNRREGISIQKGINREREVR